MPKVYSYLRFSDPRQSSGSSADRQLEYTRRWAAERGLLLDEGLSMRDEGLSAYSQRHITHGAMGVFLRAVEDGRIESGSVLVVEGLDRLSRAEPIQAQAQLAQIVQAGITVVTASDSKEYNRARLKANPMDLVYSLLVMIRAHEESDTKSKRVRAAIRRQCEGWQAGTFRGPIRNGRDPHWVRWTGSAFELVPERAEALRYAVSRFMAGLGAVQVMRELAARGMNHTERGALGSAHLYRTLKKRLLIGEREIVLQGERYRLAGYYPALLTEVEFDALQVAVHRRGRKRGVGEIPSILTGMGIAVCGYCGGGIASQNLMGRKRMPDGRPWTGHRRLICARNSSGHGCPVGGTIQAAPVERALMIYCADRMRMADLIDGGGVMQALRADLAKCRSRLGNIESRLDRLARALAEDDHAAPMAVLRQIRTLETEADAERQAAAVMERELGAQRPAPPDMAERWLDLIEGVEALDTEARMQARELARESFSRIVLWHAGNPATGETFEIEISARGGGSMRLRCDRATGGLLDERIG